jgi:hypothetical protein
VSFVVLAFAWRTPRFRGDRAGHLVPVGVDRVVSHPVTRWAVRLLGLAFAAYVAWAALFGEDLATNPTLGVFYVYLWVGMVALSLLVGNVWPLLSPMRTLHRLVCRAFGANPQAGLAEYPRWLGRWPAALGLFAFVWTELVYPEAAYVVTVVVWVTLYAAAMLVGSAVFGSRWFVHADPFEVYFTLVARLSPWGRLRDASSTNDGRLVVRSPLDNLDGVSAGPGLVAVLAVLLGSTAFDSFSASNFWLAQTARPGAFDPVLRDTLALAALAAFVALTFCAAAMLAPGITRRERQLMPTVLAHSLLPITVGYMFAHYLTLLLEYGQQTLVQLSDPLASGANYLGTADNGVSFFLSSRPELLAALKVAFIVAGHVAGVVTAHDRAVRVLSARHAVVEQMAMLTVMVVYTVGGLLLLFSS